MAYSVSTLLIRNLHDDLARRRAAIDEIFTIPTAVLAAG